MPLAMNVSESFFLFRKHKIYLGHLDVTQQHHKKRNTVGEDKVEDVVPG